jgi:DNA primase
MSNLAGLHSDIDAVRDATDLVRLIGEHVALRPKGREHVGLCPFHDDKTPSFCVVTHKGNAFYKCHACGAGGDAFDFVMNYHRMEFGEALRFLAERAGIKLQPRKLNRSGGSDDAADSTSSRRTDLKKANAFAATFFQRMLNDQTAGAGAREVIATRGISDAMVQTFGLGAAPDQWDALSNLICKRGLPESLFLNAGLLKQRKEGEGHYDAFRNRLIFPIFDDVGNPIAFGARKINPEDEPKYLNSAESPLFSKSKTLYGLHRAKRAIIESKQAIVTEGYTDVIACHQAGICNVVGTLGTALTRDHARMLSRLCETVVLVFDGDEAGQKAADRGLEVFFAEPVDIKICVLPDELDPDELLKEPNGRERFEQALVNSIEALAFKISRFCAQLERATGISARQKRLDSFLAELANLGFASLQGVKKRLVLAQLAELFDVPIADIEASMPKSKRSQSPPANESIDAESDDESMHIEVKSDADVPPARRRAEYDLLAILIYQPELHAHSIALTDEREGDFTSLFTIEDFIDPLSRALIEVMLPHFQRGEPFTVQQLLGRIDHPDARTLAPALYFDGQRLCETASDSIDSLRSAAHCLHSHVNLHEFQKTVSQYRIAAASKDAPEQAILAARSVIEQRRRQGHIAAAIVRGVRS